MRLSKSKLMAFRQCPKRLWLEVHQPQLAKVSDTSQRAFENGHRVGQVAQRLFVPDGNADLIDIKLLGHEGALKRTRELVEAGARPIFEAGFAADGVLAYADVLLPVMSDSKPAWRMVEVKSSTSVKDHHVDDASIQAYLARTAGVTLSSISVATIDSSFVYPGEGRYQGLLKQIDITEQTLKRQGDVASWIPAAHAVAQATTEPENRVGSQCTEPFECGFMDHCSSKLPQATFPVAWLPGGGTKPLKERLSDPEVRDMTQVSDSLLNALQLRVKQRTISNEPFVDKDGGAREALAPCALPVHALDFETINFAVPVWPGTRPYEAIPFQFSFHSLTADRCVEHTQCLDLSGDNPARGVAESLVRHCTGTGPILVYSAYEKTQLKGLAARFPDLAGALDDIRSRLFDLYPVAKKFFYHPSQKGSWSIKDVLPAFAGQSYASLDVAGGQAAMDAYLEAINPSTPRERIEALRDQLLQYCGLDTKGLLLLWRAFAARDDLRI